MLHFAAFDLTLDELQSAQIAGTLTARDIVAETSVHLDGDTGVALEAASVVVGSDTWGRVSSFPVVNVSITGWIGYNEQLVETSTEGVTTLSFH